MKKLFPFTHILIILMLAQCGPSQKELNEKRINDSIRVADSMRKVDSVNAILNFKIGFISIGKFLFNPTLPEVVETGVSAKYSLVSKADGVWKFRDESKSWEAVLTLGFNKSTRIVDEISFTAPQSRVYDYLDELKKEMGFHFVNKEVFITGDWLETYQNTEKGLTVKFFPVEYIGPGLMYYRLYRTEIDE